MYKSILNYIIIIILIGILMYIKVSDNDNWKLMTIIGLMLGLLIVKLSYEHLYDNTIENYNNISNEIPDNLPILMSGGDSKEAVPSKEITLYYATWCPLSMEFLPTWNEFRKIANAQHPSLRISEIKCEDGNERICHEKEVPGYPYIILENEGTKNIFEEYPRTLEKLLSFVNNNI
jgi:thiol-disulfide isomerase/thioredoxin